MLAILEGFLGQLVVCPHRSHHGNQVDVRGVKHFVLIGGESHSRMSLAQAFLGLGILVANESYFGGIVRMKIADDIRTPVTVTNHTNADHTSPSGITIP